MLPAYQVIVVGAGPAGSMAALYAAKSGLSVALFERKEIIGEPLRCGELIRSASVSAFLPVETSFVSNYVNSYKIVGPCGNSFFHEEKDFAVILDRKKFDKVLAQQAADAGADIFTDTEVIEVLKEKERISGVVLLYRNERKPVRCDFLIAADGVASRVARLAGIKSNLPVGGLAATISSRVEIPGWEQGSCELYFGRSVAPGGYVWVFPKEKGVANIGIGINGNYSKQKSSLDFLTEFLKARFPKYKLVSYSCGGIPVYRPLKNITCRGLLLVGDAARLTNPLTGAGIYLAMLSGSVAGRSVAMGDEAEAQYEQFLQKKIYPLQLESFQARRKLDKAPDHSVDAAIKCMSPFDKEVSVVRALIGMANHTNNQQHP